MRALLAGPRAFCALAAGAAALAVAGMAAAPASAAPARTVSTGAPATVAAANTAKTVGRDGQKGPAAAQLPGLVSSSPVSWTPNVFAGSPACDPQWFGPSATKHCAPSTVYATAVVNGEVVVAGAFTQACAPGPGSEGHCVPGTLVTRDDIFAYELGTGTIDPDFAPVLDQGPVNALVAGPNDTVYVAGDFTTVNGAAQEGVAQLSVTPGAPTDGQVVPGFAGQLTGTASSLAFDGASALYVGGQFTKADGTASKSLVRLNATTGAVDSSFSFTLGDPIKGTGLHVNTMALSPDGSQLVVAGSFLQVNGQSIPRIAVIQTGGGLGDAATLANWSAPVLANTCSHQHDYVNGVDFSPNGVDFDVVTTGYTSGGGAAICDAASRFSAAATGTDVQPVWTDYAGGDSFHSVVDTGSIVYVGGHNRWLNNECGDNHACEANAVLVNGVGALDANTGLALPWWQPQTVRGVGVSSLTVVPAGASPSLAGGLLLGTDVSDIGGIYHSQDALFPLTNTTAQTPGGPIPSGLFADGRPGGQESTTNGAAAECVDDAGDSSTSGNKVQLWTCQNDASQNWTLEPDETIQINGLCLSVAGTASTLPNGSLVQVATCDGATSQEWVQGTGNTLVNQNAGKCLDDPNASTKSGAKLQIWACNGNPQQVWPLPSAQAPPPPPATGPVYSPLLQKNTDVPCAEDSGNSKASGTAVVIWMCAGYPDENWTAEQNGTIQINGLCMDTNGTAVVLDTCSGASSQVWTPGANYILVNQASGMCLDDPSSETVNGSALDVETCSSATNEQWRLPTV